MSKQKKNSRRKNKRRNKNVGRRFRVAVWLYILLQVTKFVILPALIYLLGQNVWTVLGVCIIELIYELLKE